MPRSVHSGEHIPHAPTLETSCGGQQKFPTLDLINTPPHTHNLPQAAPEPVLVAHLFPPLEGCDLVLRATKFRPHIQFYVDRETVYKHSSYLKRKISELGPFPGSMEVVSWEENAAILDAMLRFIYSNRPRPQVESIAHLRCLLEAARKYDIQAAKRALGTAVLLEFATREPISSFSLACQFGLDNEADLISKETLKVDIMMNENSSELNRVSLSYYHRLLRLHKIRATKAIDIVNLINAEHPMDELDPPYCDGCGSNATWWQVFVQFGGIELKRRPVTDTIFSAAFLAKCVRTARQVCGPCVDSYMQSDNQKLLARLKENIDALPAYISAVDPYATK